MGDKCETCGKETEELTEGLCKQCTDEAGEDNIASSQPQTKATPCECGEGPVNKSSMMNCTSCLRWWHPSCVGLAGLSKYATNTIIKYKCPCCFKFGDKIMENVRAEMEQNVEEEKTDIKAEVKRQISEAIPALVSEVVTGVKSAFGESQVKEMVSKANDKITQSWADVAKSEQKKIITDVVEKTSETALKKSICLIDANLSEQKKRVRNIVISNIPEDYGRAEDTSLAEVVVDVLGEEDLCANDIVTCKRLGEKKQGQKRFVLVVFKREEDAQYFHNWGRGRNLGGNKWVNPDLTRTERDALFKKRDERRKKGRSSEVEQDESRNDPPAVGRPIGRGRSRAADRPPPPPYRRSSRSNSR